MADQTEIDKLAAVEFQSLQKKHRSLQLELRTCLDIKTKQLKTHNRVISVLQQELEALKDAIKTIEDGTHARINVTKEKRLCIIKGQYLKLQKLVENEKINVWELEGHIKKMEKGIEVLRKNEVSDSCYKVTIVKVQKNVIKLENRLDVVNKKCSDILTENTKLRNSINHMLQERANFNEMWQSMVAQFNEGKKFIMDLIDTSSLAFDQREELCIKLQALKDRNENDKLMHIQEMREMQRRLEHDAKLQQFFDVKGKKRINAELELREVGKRMQKNEDFERRLGEYKDIIEKIKNLCVEKENDCLDVKFKRQEEENFALFNYVNELSHEVEILNVTTKELNDEIERQKADEAEREFKQKTEAEDYLKAEQRLIRQSASVANRKKNFENVRLHQLLLGIDTIFGQIHQNDAPILNVLSSKSNLTVHSVKLFLGVIERKINLIISNISADELPSKILAKKDRVPKFNVKETNKIQN